MWSPGRGRAWTSASIHASSVSVLRHDVDSRLKGEPKAIERDSSFSGYQRLAAGSLRVLTLDAAVYLLLSSAGKACAARGFSCVGYEWGT
ncbi:hypothetical protein VTN00DRAFT_1810 [Thermoascus crustaceus]|uniref:uncharacterized protein n=1 Tax=Thermoascus crustaceus TaxID=5088 RepID=UPI00374288D4